jgi:hypothetical protein
MLDNQHSTVLLCSHSKRAGRQAGTVASKPKGVNRMSKEFFHLPESVKRRIWAELLEQWAKRKPATH